ncbi:MAG: transposase domain-containing protein [Paracoccaceae bacterium]
MTAAHPTQVWWTASELAASGLPNVPGTKQGVNQMASREGWGSDPERCRKREGRGGGAEYRWDLLPRAARQKLLTQASVAAAPPSTEDMAAEARALYEALPETGKARAQDRLRIVGVAEAMQRTGVTKRVAVRETAAQETMAERTLWRWYEMIEGAEPGDWLFLLAPRHRAGTASPRRRTVDPAFMDLLKGDYLRLSGPAFAACYRRVAKIASAKGIEVPPAHLARRRMNADVPEISRVLAREGTAGLEKRYPPQLRDHATLSAMEGVNADCHRFDVFVTWPGEATPSRVQMIAFQDLYSRKILSWRIDATPNKVMVMAAFGEMVDRYGVPRHVLFDNGREFANKWMTAGTATRFRFKVREDDPAGVLTLLGCRVHWATPGHGQAKPIERAFRDLAEDIAKDPRFEGAYVGNRPDAKPENYGSRAIPLDVFVPIVGELIEAHNARLGRLTPTARGGSFDEAFAASYATSPVRKATEEQRRLWLMGQEVRKLHRDHARLSMFENAYWSPWMTSHAGEEVVVRFDPEELHAGVHLYAKDGAYLGRAECEEKVGFFDLEGAQLSARRRAAMRRAEKAALKATRPVGAREIAAELDALHGRDPAPATAEAKVVRPVFARPEAPVAQRARPAAFVPEEGAPVDPALVADITAARGRQIEAETATDRFGRALDIERRAAAGERVGDAEARWLEGYRGTPEHRAQADLYETYGDRLLGR